MQTTYTFKAQAKSNAKRFLVKTSQIDEANLDKYLTQVDGQWGTYIAEDGTPVQFATVALLARTTAAWDGLAAAEAEGAALDAAGVPPLEELPAKLLDEAEHAAQEPAGGEDEGGPAAPSAFGAFAMAQLTAPSNGTATEPARAHREGATPTAGLKIQKDRPEQNGVRRQSAGSVGDKLWALYDAAGAEVTLEQAKTMAAAASLSPTSAAIALYNWRKFHGINSRTAK